MNLKAIPTPYSKIKLLFSKKAEFDATGVAKALDEAETLMFQEIAKIVPQGGI